MKMPMSTALPLDQMSLDEKLRALEALWDDLCRREESVPVPTWHRELLDERQRLIEEGKVQFSDWETAKRRIAEQTR